MQEEQPEKRPVYTVSRLNQEVRLLLETGFPTVWVEGELSRVTRPSSGHLYFTLKDARARVDCAMWRSSVRGLRFAPREGQQVLVRGRIGLYEVQGRYQLIAESMEEAGEGRLRQRLEELRGRLAAEGLFDETRKRALPTLPRRIGVVTSPTGAAVRDVLKVLARRFPAVPVLIYPTPVQGEGSAESIARMLATASRRAECDVLILCRGGGSLEDLWSFNEEVVVRAVHASEIPVICGVGHEVDVTLADLAADQRAPTPSGAAELAVPDRDEWLRRLHVLDRRLAARLGTRLSEARRRHQGLSRRLQARHPGVRLRQHGQRLDELEGRLRRRLGQDLERRTQWLSGLRARLLRHGPGRRIRTAAERLGEQRGRLSRAISRVLAEQGRRLAHLAHNLDTVSPLATLERGYAIVERASDGHILRDTAGLRPGDGIRARLAGGTLRATVDELEDPEEG